MRTWIGRESLLILAALALAVGGGMMLVYRPQGQRMEELKQRIATQKAMLLSDAHKAAVVPDVLRQIAEMREDYKDIDRKVPERTELGGFLREISANLAEENLSNQLIEPGNPTAEELFHTLPIIMKFRGPYLSLASLLKRIDGMQRLARIQDLRVERDSQEPELNIELQLNIYFTDKKG